MQLPADSWASLDSEIESIPAATPIVEGMKRHALQEMHRIRMASELDAERAEQLRVHIELMRQATDDPIALEGKQFVVAFEMASSISRDWPGHYWVYLPNGYFDDSDKKWPTVYFLHGSGERGDDPHAVLLHGPPKHLIDDRRDYPAIVFSPQAPDSYEWELDFLEAFAADAESRFNVDRNAITLTGISRGGAGAWKWAIENTERFAAVAPVCGWVNPLYAIRLRDIPTWVVHSANDPVVAVYESDLAVLALRTANADVRYRRTKNEGHGSWRSYYADGAFWEWALVQKKNADDSPPEHPRESLQLHGDGAGDGLGPMHERLLADMIPPGDAWSIMIEATDIRPADAIHHGLWKLYHGWETTTGRHSDELVWMIDETWYFDGHWRAKLALPQPRDWEGDTPEGVSLATLDRTGRVLGAFFHGTVEETENAWHRMEQRALLDGYSPNGRRMQRVLNVEREGTIMMRELLLGIEE